MRVRYTAKADDGRDRSWNTRLLDEEVSWNKETERRVTFDSFHQEPTVSSTDTAPTRVISAGIWRLPAASDAPKSSASHRHLVPLRVSARHAISTRRERTDGEGLSSHFVRRFPRRTYFTLEPAR